MASIFERQRLASQQISTPGANRSAGLSDVGEALSGLGREIDRKAQAEAEQIRATEAALGEIESNNAALFFDSLLDDLEQRAVSRESFIRAAGEERDRYASTLRSVDSAKSFIDKVNRRLLERSGHVSERVIATNVEKAEAGINAGLNQNRSFASVALENSEGMQDAYNKLATNADELLSVPGVLPPDTVEGYRSTERKNLVRALVSARLSDGSFDEAALAEVDGFLSSEGVAGMFTPDEIKGFQDSMRAAISHNKAVRDAVEYNRQSKAQAEIAKKVVDGSLTYAEIEQAEVSGEISTTTANAAKESLNRRAAERKAEAATAKARRAEAVKVIRGEVAERYARLVTIFGEALTGTDDERAKAAKGYNFHSDDAHKYAALMDFKDFLISNKGVLTSSQLNLLVRMSELDAAGVSDMMTNGVEDFREAQNWWRLGLIGDSLSEDKRGDFVLGLSEFLAVRRQELAEVGRKMTQDDRVLAMQQYTKGVALEERPEWKALQNVGATRVINGRVWEVVGHLPWGQPLMKLRGAK